jgi:hypothetical protein
MAHAAITNESGSFIDEIKRLRDLSFDADTGLYVAPSSNVLSTFYICAEQLMNGDLPGASSSASTLGYDLVIFTDTNTSQVFYGLREQLDSGGNTTNGWGSYFVNPSNEVSTLIEVPHPRFDTYSYDIGSRAFSAMRAKAFLMAGAHRNANGQGTADVAHLSNTVFHAVHQAWNGPSAENIAWQVHGFSISNYPGFPVWTDVVLSNGDGDISMEVRMLDKDLFAEELVAYSYNTLATNSALNMEVNDGVAGTNFNGLGGTQNVQGAHSRSLGGRFVHIEIERAVRFDATNRISAANGIVSAGRHAAETAPAILGISFQNATQAVVQASQLVQSRHYELHENLDLLSDYWLTNMSWSANSAATNLMVTISTNSGFLRLMLK